MVLFLWILWWICVHSCQCPCGRGFIIDSAFCSRKWFICSRMEKVSFTLGIGLTRQVWTRRQRSVFRYFSPSFVFPAVSSISSVLTDFTQDLAQLLWSSPGCSLFGTGTIEGPKGVRDLLGAAVSELRSTFWGFCHLRSAMTWKQVILLLTWYQNIRSSLMPHQRASVLHLTLSHHGGIFLHISTTWRKSMPR